jgi:hypothetical protein
LFRLLFAAGSLGVASVAFLDVFRIVDFRGWAVPLLFVFAPAMVTLVYGIHEANLERERG